jgi:hypothetical protein
VASKFVDWMLRAEIPIQKRKKPPILPACAGPIKSNEEVDPAKHQRFLEQFEAYKARKANPVCESPDSI